MNTFLSKFAAGATIGAITVALSLATAAPAQAFTANVQQATDHYVNCFNLMLTDPAAHAAQCSPSTIPQSLASLSTPVAAGTPAPAYECGWKGMKGYKGKKGEGFSFRRSFRPN